jgi:hypothetical protein
LSKLALEVSVKAPGDVDEDNIGDDADPIAACASLAGLTGLKDLTIESPSRMVPGDALALTALTALTRLDLSGAGCGVDDVVATALACSLKQLQCLDLSRTTLKGGACLAAIGHLSQLTALVLSGVECMTERDLMLLTRLRALQRLHVQKNAVITDEVLNRFWATQRQQHQ